MNIIHAILLREALATTRMSRAVDQAQLIRDRAAARTQHVAKVQPHARLFRHNWADLEARAKNGRKAEN